MADDSCESGPVREFFRRQMQPTDGYGIFV